MATFWENLENYGNALCVSGETSLSYLELAHAADACFSDAKRAVAFIICRKNLATIIGYIGCLRHKIVPVLLPEDISENNLKNLIDLYQPKYIWASSLDVNFSITLEKSKSAYGYDLFILDTKPYDISDELGLLLTTSGSTGSPKLVRLSYKNLDANANSIVRALSINADHIPVSLLPFHYSFGLSVLNSHLKVGAKIIVTNHSLLQREFWQCAKEHSITSLYAVPYHLEILQKLNFKRINLRSLSLLAQAGGRLSEVLREYYYQLSSDLNFNFFIMYGQTEASARISCLPPNQFPHKKNSVGKAIPGGKLVIHNPDTDGVGEIIYEGDNVSLGYATSYLDLAHDNLNKGVLNTNDLGYLDKDGYLYISGRKNRFIKVFGNRINLDHLEQLVKQVDHQAAVIGRDDLIKILTLNDNMQEIQACIINNTNLNKQAFKIEKIDSLSVKLSGKVDYADMNNRYLD